MNTMRLPSGLKAVILGALIFLGAALPLSAQSGPLLLVADLEYAGVNNAQMKLLVDLISYMIFENGAYTVMNRYERNKLLRGFGYGQTNLKDRTVYLEAADLLRARYIVTGSCLPADGALALSLQLWDVASGSQGKSVTFAAPDFPGLAASSRTLIERFLGKPLSAGPVRHAASGLSETLYVTRIRERLLIALPSGELDDQTAAARLLVAEAAAKLADDERLSVFFTSVDYQPQRPAPESFTPLLASRDCHSLGLVVKEGSEYFLCLYQPDFSVRLKLPLSFRLERKTEAEALAQKFRETLSPFPTAPLARELEREIVIKDKLDLLLFKEKFLSRRFAITLETMMVLKPAVAGIYQPLLDIIAVGMDGFWYYGQVFGVGAGYAFSLGYPATLDAGFAAHPLIRQHEFRFIPLSFRTPGSISVILNFITALNMQNAYRVDASGPTPQFLDETTLLCLKLGVNMGIGISINDDFSLFIDLATMCYILPLNLGTVTNNGTNFSGAFGGIGVTARF
jgi:hypothetical protein